MKEINVIGMDISKHSFEVCGGNERGKVVLRKNLSRAKVTEFFANLKRCTVMMEACGSANYWARELQSLGHEVKLIAPQFVKPFVKTNKNDAADAEGIMEAGQRPTMRFVPIKSISQQDIGMMHRVRERLIKARTALSNEIRGLLAEYGVTIPKGISHVRKGLTEILSKEHSKLTDTGYQIFLELYAEFLEYDKKVSAYDERFELMAQEDGICKRLCTIPGIGAITASALVAAVGDPKVFKNGRQFAAWLGLVPKQNSTGGKVHLLGISKRGDSYIRKLAVHGARAVVARAEKHGDKRSVWIGKLLNKEKGMNRTAVAVANKNMRTAWALMMKEGEVYHEFPVAA